METPFTTAIHVIQTVTSLPIAYFCVVLLRQHKIWVRMKDYVNTMWADHCDKVKQKYIAVDGNGH